jgi:hypothetical protein
MDGDTNDLELLLASIGQEISALRDDRRLAPLPGSRGAALRDHVLDLLGAVDHRIAQQPDPGASQAVHRAFARSLRQGIVVLRGAHAALPWLAATRAPNINLGSLYVTEECARILVGTDVDLVVVPDPEFMYSTTSWPFSAVIEGTHGFTSTAKRRPIVLNYPLSDSDRLLLHPIFAHELSHASVDEHKLVAAVESRLDADPPFLEALQHTVTAMSADWPAATQTQITGTLRASLRDWIEELLCDHLATEAMGPAFMWSFAAFAMPLTYGEPTPVHPPNTMRIRLILNHLTRRGWRPYLDRVAPKVTAWLDGVAADANGSLSVPFPFLRDQLLTHESALQDAATGRIGSGSLDPKTSEPEAKKAADLLERLILPVGLDGPLEPRSILLGGWQEALRKNSDRPEGLVKALEDRPLQDLVGKAIEMSTVTSSWKATA